MGHEEVKRYAFDRLHELEGLGKQLKGMVRVFGVKTAFGVVDQDLDLEQVIGRGEGLREDFTGFLMFLQIEKDDSFKVHQFGPLLGARLPADGLERRLRGFKLGHQLLLYGIRCVGHGQLVASFQKIDGYNIAYIGASCQ